MIITNQHTNFQRNLRSTRLAFSNLRSLFTPGSNIVCTFYEIVAVLCVLFIVGSVTYLVVHFTL